MKHIYLALIACAVVALFAPVRAAVDGRLLDILRQKGHGCHITFAIFTPLVLAIGVGLTSLHRSRRWVTGPLALLLMTTIPLGMRGTNRAYAQAAAGQGAVAITLYKPHSTGSALEISLALKQRGSWWPGKEPLKLILATQGHPVKSIDVSSQTSASSASACVFDDEQGLGRCTFDVPRLVAGPYVITAMLKDKEIGRLELALVPVRTTWNTVLPLVEDREKVLGHAKYLPRERAIEFYATTDPRCVDQDVQFVWLKGGHIVQVRSEIVNCPKLDRPEPLAPVNAIKTTIPDVAVDSVLVFQEGKQSLGSVGFDSHVNNGLLPLIDSLPPGMVTAAQTAAFKDHEQMLRGSIGELKAKRSEPTVCAIVSNEKARNAYLEAVKSSNSAAFAYQDALDASESADAPGTTKDESSSLRKRAGAKALQNKQGRKDEKAWVSLVRTIAAHYQTGCLAKLISQ